MTRGHLAGPVTFTAIRAMGEAGNCWQLIYLSRSSMTLLPKRCRLISIASTDPGLIPRFVIDQGSGLGDLIEL